MGEENNSENRVKASRFADQNHIPKGNSTKGSSNTSKPKSSWGSNIVKGFSADKKTKLQTKKLPLTNSNSNSDASGTKTTFLPSHLRAKRTVVTDLYCSANATQVHPQSHKTTNRPKSSAGSQSHNLYLELDNLRNLLQESKEREHKLQAELSECKRNPEVFDLERKLELKKGEIDSLQSKLSLLESEKTSLLEQLTSLTSVLERKSDTSKRAEEEISQALPSRNLEMEVLELRRLNMELQLQKRNLSCRISSMESQLASPSKISESDVVENIKREASLLRHTNEDLSKQVEGLQMSRLNEVEELIYLRWVNSCLRTELQNSSFTNSDQTPTHNLVERSGINESSSLSSCSSDEIPEYSSTKRISLIKKLKKWPITDEDLQNLECQETFSDHNWEESWSPKRRHSISGSKLFAEDLLVNKRRQSDGFIISKEVEKETDQPLDSSKYEIDLIQTPEITKLKTFSDVEKRALRVPNPPPRRSCTVLVEQKEDSCIKMAPPPPPPPPPPPKFSSRSTSSMVQRAPQVVEFYHSLMKRDSRKDSINGGGVCDAAEVANVRCSMIGEIENRSSHLLAIKADVETQGEFVNSLIREVNDATYSDIKDVVAFVKWLDDELCFLVDERAVLKHFDWPEKKADTLREAAFGYRDLKKLEYEVSNYKDDQQLPCDIALKKMLALSEKMERIVYSILRTRDLLMRNCKEFQIPTDWMADNGILSKIKFDSVKLAKRYMKRVAMELQTKGTSEKDSSMDYMLLQGVRFAFRIHQFAGGFDAETMHAFEELRNLALVLNKE